MCLYVCGFIAITIYGLSVAIICCYLYTTNRATNRQTKPDIECNYLLVKIRWKYEISLNELASSHAICSFKMKYLSSIHFGRSKRKYTHSQRLMQTNFVPLTWTLQPNRQHWICSSQFVCLHPHNSILWAIFLVLVFGLFLLVKIEVEVVALHISHP